MQRMNYSFETLENIRKGVNKHSIKSALNYENDFFLIFSVFVLKILG